MTTRRALNVLVVTCVHRGDDARVYQRQVRQLVEAGHRVVYIAPAMTSDVATFRGVTHIVIPRAVGRQRLASWRAVREAVKAHRTSCDVMVVHDPELTVVLRGTGDSPAVFDVKEDTPAAIADKAWIPVWARPAARRSTTVLERWASRSYHLLLAEYSYRKRFGDHHAVVPNSTWVPSQEPKPTGRTVVYLGRISRHRGAETLLRVGRALEPGRLLLIGDAAADVRDDVAHAAALGQVRWTGFLPNPEALALVEGALVGLSLLAPEPNYLHSQPTKLAEYFARGVPAITTPLPLAKELVEQTGAGLVVPYQDSGAVVRAIATLDGDPALRAEMGRLGYEAARAQFDWSRDGREFVTLLEGWSRTPSTSVT